MEKNKRPSKKNKAIYPRLTHFSSRARESSSEAFGFSPTIDCRRLSEVENDEVLMESFVACGGDGCSR